jgi:hypothetical protein
MMTMKLSPCGRRVAQGFGTLGALLSTQVALAVNNQRCCRRKWRWP